MGTSTARDSRREKLMTAILAVMIGSAGVGLTVWAFRGGSSQGHSPRGIRPGASLAPMDDGNIQGTVVPLPPAEFNFSPQDHGAWIDALGEAHILLGESADPSILAGEAEKLLEFYAEQMPPLGFTLSENFPIGSVKDDADFPPEAVTGGQTWTNGSDVIGLQVTTWTPWSGIGWTINITVIERPILGPSG